jgi:hypothetical protein
MTIAEEAVTSMHQETLSILHTLTLTQIGVRSTDADLPPELADKLANLCCATMSAFAMTKMWLEENSTAPVAAKRRPSKAEQDREAVLLKTVQRVHRRLRALRPSTELFD